MCLSYFIIQPTERLVQVAFVTSNKNVFFYLHSTNLEVDQKGLGNEMSNQQGWGWWTCHKWFVWSVVSRVHKPNGGCIFTEKRSKSLWMFHFHFNITDMLNKICSNDVWLVNSWFYGCGKNPPACTWINYDNNTNRCVFEQTVNHIIAAEYNYGLWCQNKYVIVWLFYRYTEFEWSFSLTDTSSDLWFMLQDKWKVTQSSDTAACLSLCVPRRSIWGVFLHNVKTSAVPSRKGTA